MRANPYIDRLGNGRCDMTMRITLVLLMGPVLTWFAPANAQALYSDETKPDGWAWAHLQHDEMADLNRRCPDGRTSVSSRPDVDWDNDCRKITAKFITDIVTDPQLRNRIGRHGIQLKGARVDGTLDLVNAEVSSALSIIESRIDGDLNLTDTHLTHRMHLDGTQVRGRFLADQLRSDSSLFLSDHAAFEDDVILNGAKISGDVSLGTSSFAKHVYAYGMTVGGDLLAEDQADFKGDVVLSGAKINGDVSLNTSRFAQRVYAYGMTVGGNLFAGDQADFKGDVVLRDAKIYGDVSLDTSRFAGDVDASSMTVGGRLFARDAPFSHAT